MALRDLYPQEILQVVLDKSCAKAQSSIPTLAILSVLAGGYIGFGYLAYLKVVSGIPHEWSGFATLLGAAVFPIALICILLGGGELVTSNMMIMSLGRLAGRISSKMLLRNRVIVCMGNLVGTLAMAFFLGYYVGMIEGSVAEKPLSSRKQKSIWISVALLYRRSHVTGWSAWARGCTLPLKTQPDECWLFGSPS